MEQFLQGNVQLYVPAQFRNYVVVCPEKEISVQRSSK